MRFLILLALAPLSALAQSRTSIFVGCSSGAPGVDFPSSSTLINNNPPPTSPNTCAASCSSQYSYYRTSDSVCRCSDDSPPSGFYADSIAVNNPGTCASSAAYSVIRRQTTYRFSQCGTYGTSTGINELPTFTATSIDDCLTQCRFFTALFISPIGTSGSEFQCRCGRAGSFTYNNAVCGPGATKFYAFSHAVLAASGGLTKRRRSQGRMTGPEEFCPAGLTPCRVSGSEDGYECIDTTSELESCGGCVFGRYGTRKRGVKGVNCASLDNRDFGSMTCKAGRCVNAF